MTINASNKLNKGEVKMFKCITVYVRTQVLLLDPICNYQNTRNILLLYIVAMTKNTRKILDKNNSYQP